MLKNISVYCVNVFSQIKYTLKRTVLEGALSEFSGFLLELFDCTLVDTTALVDQVTGSGGLAGIDMSDNYMREARMNETSQRSSNR